MKKLICILLSLAMLLSLVTVASADEAESAALSAASGGTDYIIGAGNGKVLTAGADGEGVTLTDYVQSGIRSQHWRFMEQNGETVIYNRLNNRALTFNGEAVVLAANKGGDGQLLSVSEDGVIKSRGGLSLAIGDGEEVVASAAGFNWQVRTPAQMLPSESEEAFDAAPVTIGGTMVLLQEGTGYVLSVAEDNVTLTTSAYKMGEKGQLFDFEKNGESFNLLNNRAKTYVDVSGNSHSPGGQLILWRGTGGDNQKWSVEQENGRCYVKSIFSGLYITANNGAITQQNKADATAWLLLSIDEINAAFIAGTGNSEGFENRRRLLENLGVADEGRTYYENAVVTNRDAVKAAVRLITGGSEFTPTATSFGDVPADDPDSGYIAQALILELISPRANFYPDNAARADELVEAVLRGLNYSAVAKTSGGYMALANNKKLLKGVSAFEDNTLTYSQLFKILENTLSVEVFSKLSPFVVKNGTSLRDSRWNIEVMDRARIKDVSYSDKTFTAEYEGESYSFLLPENYFSADLKGIEADIWYNNDTDEIVNIAPHSGYSVEYGYITAVNGVEEASASFNPALVKTLNLNYRNKSLKISESADITMDASSSFGASVRMVGSFARAVIRNNTVVAIDCYELTEGGLFSGTDGENIVFRRGENPNVKIKNIDGYDNVIVLVNNKLSTVSNLPSNALFDYCDAGATLLVAAYVNTAIGVFDSLGEEGYVIDEVEYIPENIFASVYYSYDMGKNYSADSSRRNSFINNSVTLYLDGAGRIRYMRGDNSGNDFIGVITDIKVGSFDKLEAITVFSDYTGVMSTQSYKLKLSKKSEISEEDLLRLYNTNDTDNSVYEFHVSGGRITKIMNLEWLTCSDDSKDLVSAAVKGTLVKDYGEERINQLFADPKMFITGWTMGRDYGLTRIHFFAKTSAGEPYTLICGGFNTRYIMAFDSDENFRPREISWYDYRNTNFDRSFLKVGFKKDNKEKLSPDIVYILSGNKYVAVSSWDVHGVVKKIEEYDDETTHIELIEPNNYIGHYIIEKEEDMVGYWDNITPSVGDVITLNVHGNYEKVYYNIYGEAISESEAAELEDEGEYVELREEYQTNGYAAVAKTWNMLSEIGKYNNDYCVTYVDNVYKIDGNLMYYRDSVTGAIQAYSAASGNLFIMEDPSKYIMFDYEDLRRKKYTSPITLDDINVEANGGESDKLLIFSVSRGRYPKVIIRMPSDWEP